MTYSCVRNFVPKSFLNILNILTQMSLSPSPMLTQTYFVRAVRRPWYLKQHWGKKTDTSVSRNLRQLTPRKNGLFVLRINYVITIWCPRIFFTSQNWSVLILRFIKSALVRPPNKNLSLIFDFSYSFIIIWIWVFLKIFQFFTTKFA